MAYAQDLINRITSGVGARDFGRDAFTWSQFFNRDDARAGASQEATGYYNPLRQRALGNVNQNFAQRGLFRSGIRGREVNDTNADYNDKQQQMIERLYNIRERDTANDYNRLRQQYEQDPTGFMKDDFYSGLIKKYRGVQ